ncbi:hypothetical protein [Streptomyces sp. NPDC058206]|uniref:hypothetical protein n=1 Tax=Streptomyces sp. NPDC058206 TaxID=3346382 RepID=UPI0036E291AE
MDAGIAGLLGGVLGAAVGAAGTTAGAWLTARRSVEQAEIQAQAQLDQTRLTVHHGLRRTTYADYAAALDAFHDCVDPRWWDGFSAGCSSEDATATADEVTARARELSRAWSRVAIDGPEHVATAALPPLNFAHRIRRAISTDAQVLSTEPPGEITPADEATALIRSFNRANDAFLKAAGTALHPDEPR